MRLTLLDYGIGNLRSLEKAFAHEGVEVERTDAISAVERAERLVVPGVWASEPARVPLRGLAR